MRELPAGIFAAFAADAAWRRRQAISAYKRSDLEGLIDLSDAPSDKQILSRLESALNYERNLAAQHHWSYDYPRHFRLSIAHAAETGTN
jgi:hypothetical protein